MAVNTVERRRQVNRERLTTKNTAIPKTGDGTNGEQRFVFTNNKLYLYKNHNGSWWRIAMEKV